MAVPQAQGARLLDLQTALGKNELQAVSFHTDETISVPYMVTVETVSDSASIDPDSVLYKPACLKVTFGQPQPRILHGFVRSFVATGEPQRGRYSYSLTFAPRLWFMSQTTDCRIFCNKSVDEIISTLCGEASQTIEVKVSGAKPQKPYVTQYNETDLTFLSRLAEEAGYFYYFQHTESDHTLVLADANSSFPQTPKPSLTVAHQGGGTDVLTAWHRIGGTAHGKYTLRDYDPLNPSTPPEGMQPTKAGTAGSASRDVFGWPALAETNDEAKAKATRLIEAAEAEATMIEALGANPSLLPGGRFTIAADPYDGKQDVEYVVRSVSSSGQDNSWLGGDSDAGYTNRLTAFKASVSWREKIVTPRPAMSGLHTALVLGDSGDEIHADKYGRIKVRFFWDHRNDATADTTIWARVIQPWSGDTWGWQHLPRVGTEVAVAFLDGDPDRPVVIGGFYNANMMPVFEIPGEQNKSGFRSRSTKQGSSSTFSELSFDDTKGSEKVFLHAEKDVTVEVEHDRTTTIDNDDTTTVKHDQSLTVQNKQTVEVDAGRTTTIKSGDKLTVQNGGLTITASADNISIDASAGAIKVQAAQSIELTVGNSKITIDNSGVTISGLKISVEGQTMVQVKGAMTQVNADGMMMLKGGVMMLN